MILPKCTACFKSCHSRQQFLASCTPSDDQYPWLYITAGLIEDKSSSHPETRHSTQRQDGCTANLSTCPCLYQVFIQQFNVLLSKINCFRWFLIKIKIMGLAIGAVRVVVICFIGIALAVSAVALRLWSRYIQRVPLALHDWITIVALILALGSTSINMACKQFLPPLVFMVKASAPQSASSPTVLTMHQLHSTQALATISKT